jgi:sorbitol-specific phosphotransferase system component IIBC
MSRIALDLSVWSIFRFVSFVSWLVGIVTSTDAVEVGLNLCSLSFGYHLDVVADDFCDAVLILADLVGECPALDD